MTRLGTSHAPIGGSLQARGVSRTAGGTSTTRLGTSHAPIGGSLQARGVSRTAGGTSTTRLGTSHVRIGCSLLTGGARLTAFEGPLARFGALLEDLRVGLAGRGTWLAPVGAWLVPLAVAVEDRFAALVPGRTWLVPCGVALTCCVDRDDGKSCLTVLGACALPIIPAAWLRTIGVEVFLDEAWIPPSRTEVLRGLVGALSRGPRLPRRSTFATLTTPTLPFQVDMLSAVPAFAYGGTTINGQPSKAWPQAPQNDGERF